MFIETQSTPNPDSLKFLPGQTVLAGGSVEFADSTAAAMSPLARALFETPGIARVFLGEDVIVVTKRPDEDWSELKPGLLAAIMDFFATGEAAIGAEADESAETHADQGYEGEAGEIVRQIVALIDSRIRPAVAQDGGDILFHAWNHDQGIAYLRMRGACAGCPSSRMTLKAGVENMLRHYVPEVNRVEAVA